MEILLLTDIPGIGHKDDLVIVGDGFALNNLLPGRKALVATPNVRRRYAERIKQRAELKQKEQDIKKSAISALEGKEVKFSRKVTKTGKLYAAITADAIAEALKEQFTVDVKSSDVVLSDQIKSSGVHAIKVKAGEQMASLTVKVEKEEK